MGASIGPWRGHLSMSQAKEVVVSADAHVKLSPSSMQAEFETPGRQCFPHMLKEALCFMSQI